MSEELCFTPAVELAAAIRRKQVSPVEIIEAVIDRAERVNPKINALMARSYDLARDVAMKTERKIMEQGADALGPIEGLPVSIKDLTATKGIVTTYGVREYADYIPDEDAPIAARIREAGGALFAKTATPPFGWLGVTENEIIGRTNNPWDLGRTVGGSSGGAGAMVAAGIGPLATGSDGGGSIRIPSAMNGIVGHKPSLGRVPRAAESALFEVCDALGPMTRNVADAALLLGIIAGPTQDEPIMLPEAGVDYVADLRATSTRGLRVAFSPDLGQGPVDAEVAALVRQAAKHFEAALGANVEEVAIDIADPMDFMSTFYMPQLLLAQQNEPGVARLQERYPELQIGRPATNSLPVEQWWAHVMPAREKTFTAFAQIFGAYDILLTPTAPVAAWPHAGAAGPTEINGAKVAKPSIDFFRFTEPFGHSGHPALTINCGFNTAGMPVGLQIVGPMRDDRGVLRAAAAYETSTEWSKRRPAL